MVLQKINVQDIFKSLGIPTATYVRREDGKYEKELSSSLDAKGKLCLLTRPSKTGKTTLYIHVLEDKGLQPLVVRCDSNLTSEEFWKCALERIDFDRLSTSQKNVSKKISGGGKIGGTIGWKWLAGLLGEVTFGIEHNMGEIQIREKIISKPAPGHLIPVLKHLPTVLVVEDFHYLNSETKKHIFQQWKIFVDGEVSVIVVGTTHHSSDLAYANKDLIGRIAQINLTGWNSDDLEKIAIQGFEKLQLTVSRIITNTIAREAAGLPILVQQTCSQLLTDKGVTEIEPGKINLTFDRSDVYHSLHSIAITHYKLFEPLYQRLITGPRKAARKYNTYEVVLLTFCKDPLTLSLTRHQIAERLREMPLSEDERPPAASVNGMLSALAAFQNKTNMELLEWSKQDQQLYIVEPAFLFYLRWREKSLASLEHILDMLRQGGKTGGRR